jgi:hypothetical protein
MLYGSDWQTADALKYLDFRGATAFAWEFLRRDLTYQADFQSLVSAGATTSEMSERVAHRGLDCAVDPNLRADCAPVAWQPHLNPTTVLVAPAPDEFTEARFISELTPAFSRRIANGEHWLLDQGGDALQVALIDGANTTRRAAVVIPLDDSCHMRAGAALRFCEAMTGQVSDRTPDGLNPQQRSRLKLILRILDGKSAGCSYREIAKVLFDPSSVPTGCAWADDALRNRTKRLHKRGLDLVHGEYLDLMRHPRRFRA